MQGGVHEVTASKIHHFILPLQRSVRHPGPSPHPLSLAKPAVADTTFFYTSQHQEGKTTVLTIAYEVKLAEWLSPDL